jgi:hypothetical protein
MEDEQGDKVHMSVLDPCLGVAGGPKSGWGVLWDRDPRAVENITEGRGRQRRWTNVAMAAGHWIGGGGGTPPAA